MVPASQGLKEIQGVRGLLATAARHAGRPGSHRPVAGRISVLVILTSFLTVWTGWLLPAAAAEWRAGNYYFSDEQGGFELLSASGSGTSSDPIVIVERFYELRPVVLTIRLVPGLEPQFMNLAVVKVIINETGQTWSAFNVELQERLGEPSDYFDGLSFDQLGVFADRRASSDLYADIHVQAEPSDRLTYMDGYVDHGATVRLNFNLTDVTPGPLFYIRQQPQIFVSQAPAVPPYALSGDRGIEPAAYARRDLE